MAEMDSEQPSLNPCRVCPQGATWVHNHSDPDPQQLEAPVHDLAADAELWSGVTKTPAVESAPMNVKLKQPLDPQPTYGSIHSTPSDRNRLQLCK